jgi:iron uptake system component EfeO
LTLHNSGITPSEVEIVESPSGAVFGDIEGLASGATRTLRVELGSGDYAVRCVPDGIQAITGPTVHIPGDHRVAGGVRPVTKNDLTGPLNDYRRFVASGLAALSTEVAALDAKVRAGDLDAARTAWFAAHQRFEQLGAAYGAFGDDGEAISPLPFGLRGGVRDKDFAGLRRIEYGLYHGRSAAELRPVADALVAAVAKLRKDFPSLQQDPADLGLRAHEIMEDTSRFVLTGRADQGSGSELATVNANLIGTRAVLSSLRPVLTGRYTELSTMDAKLTRLATVLTNLRGTDGNWPRWAAMNTRQRESVNGAVGDALESLAPVAAICQQRRTS